MFYNPRRTKVVAASPHLLLIGDAASVSEELSFTFYFIK